MVPEFQFFEINCLRLANPVEAYTALWRGITGSHETPRMAKKKLEEYFAFGGSNKSAADRVTSVCLMDELDYLLDRDHEVLYNLFTWPREKNSRFVVIGIANVTKMRMLL